MKRAAASCCYSISCSCFLHCLRQLARHSMGWDGPHWVGDSVWRMIEVPACAEHFKYLQRYFKKRFRHVLLPLPTPPGPPCPCLQFRRHSLFVECFAHFLVERPKTGGFNFKCGMRAVRVLCPVATGESGRKEGAWGGLGGVAAALERVCPFRQVSKTVGQKTVWQLFNTIEYEVWQRQRSAVGTGMWRARRGVVRQGGHGSGPKKVAALGK